MSPIDCTMPDCVILRRVQEFYHGCAERDFPREVPAVVGDVTKAAERALARLRAAGEPFGHDEFIRAVGDEIAAEGSSGM